MTDPFDDGGTPAWRANQATWAASPRHPQTITQPYRKPNFFQRAAQLTLIQRISIVIFLGAILPWLIIIGGLVTLGVIDSIRAQF